jgi:hypothetical protein
MVRAPAPSPAIVGRRPAAMILAGAIVVMATAALVWGFRAEAHAAAAFHRHEGGFLATSTALSWVASTLVLAVAVVLAGRGAAAAARAPA